MTRKVFEFVEAQGSETPEFEIRGEVFYCKSTDDLSSIEVLDYLAGLTGGDGVRRIQTMLKLFNEFIPEGDIPRFRKTVKDTKVPLATLNEIAGWVLDEYLNFPTRAAEQSSNGSVTDGSPSEAVSTPPPDAT